VKFFIFLIADTLGTSTLGTGFADLVEGPELEGNPKHETRNPKQIQSGNSQMLKTGIGHREHKGHREIVHSR